VNCHTGFKALSKFVTAPLRMRRYFSQDGDATYVDESERLEGRAAKQTARAMSSSRRRGAELQIMYATCLCICVLLLSVDPEAVHMLSMH
jgi:hypothetical protein